MVCDHGLDWNKGPHLGFNKDDIREIYDSMYIGETLMYPCMVKDTNANDLVTMRWQKVRVTGVYPRLVTVEGIRKPVAVRSITYKEMLLDPRILSNRN